MIALSLIRTFVILVYQRQNCCSECLHLGLPKAKKPVVIGTLLIRLLWHVSGERWGRGAAWTHSRSNSAQFAMVSHGFWMLAGLSGRLDQLKGHERFWSDGSLAGPALT